jgi:hypothetical protein
LQRVVWQIDQRLGEYGLGGEWIGKEQFLIYETLAEGPLIIDVEQGVISVLTDLFGLEEIPSILDEAGYGLRAIATLGPKADAVHLLLQGIGLEGNLPPVVLYHAENSSVERLPYRAVWWQPFSADGEWLLMDERPTVEGYESHAIWMRQVEDIGGQWRLLARGVDSILWATDWTGLAYSDDETVTWQTFPAGEVVGRWDTGQFWTVPVAWSPDGLLLVTEGNVPGLWEYGLFILEP